MLYKFEFNIKQEVVSTDETPIKGLILKRWLEEDALFDIIDDEEVDLKELYLVLISNPTWDEFAELTFSKEELKAEGKNDM